MDKEEILAAARAMRPWLVETRRTLHARPELGRREEKTADYIQSRLDELGVENSRIGTAVVGLIRGAAPAAPATVAWPTVALRADIDALPITELPGREYGSTVEGAMHACGHDAHTTILLGAARFFADRRATLAGNVKLLFQPDEEGEGGAEKMVADGCLENPRVDRVAGLHVMPYLEVGQVETKKGALNGASTRIVVTARGKSAHGAYPELGVDAVLIAAHLVTAFNSLVARYVSPLEAAVITVGTIQGGRASNILADEVRLGITMRTTSDATRDLLVDRLRSVAEGVAGGFGGSAEVEVRYGYAALVNHDECVDSFAAVARDYLGERGLLWKEKPSMGVEDFSFFLRERKGLFWHLGCGNAARGISAPLHATDFDIDEDCLPLGVALQAALTLRLMEDARTEHA
jgi:amidohydrolase